MLLINLQVSVFGGLSLSLALYHEWNMDGNDEAFGLWTFRSKGWGLCRSHVYFSGPVNFYRISGWLRSTPKMRSWGCKCSGNISSLILVCTSILLCWVFLLTCTSISIRSIILLIVQKNNSRAWLGQHQDITKFWLRTEYYTMKCKTLKVCFYSVAKNSLEKLMCSCSLGLPVILQCLFLVILWAGQCGWMSYLQHDESLLNFANRCLLLIALLLNIVISIIVTMLLVWPERRFSVTKN